MIEWMKGLELNDIVEWLSILGLGFTVVFSVGKLAAWQKEIKTDLTEVGEKVDRNLNPDDPSNEIIRRADCTLQYNQFKEYMTILEDNIKKTIQIELSKN
jgi:hypothetical protein